ncbi:MAG: glycosyltransferase [Coriobacteriales bacterium]|jgi:glycosyltransferase involved in cell wall biosynthesis|nr:glycosyltransferase [Coriobacteriales bacterium]
MRNFHPRKFLRQLFGRTTAPDISVVIPVYNALPYFQTCLDHLVGQQIDLDRLEIVVVSDGSTDGSIRLAKRYRRRLFWRQPHLFQIAELPHFGGPALARNWGIEHARGRYLFFCDSDDWLNPEACRRLVRHADRWHSDTLFGRFETTQRYYRVRLFERKNEAKVDIFNHRLFRTQIACRLFRRQFLLDNQIRFPAQLVLGEDMFFMIEVYGLAKVISIAGDYPYYHSEEYETSLTRKNVTDLAPLKRYFELWPAHVRKYIDWSRAGEFTYTKLVKHLVLQLQYLLKCGLSLESVLAPAAQAVKQLYRPDKVRAGAYFDLRQKLCAQYLLQTDHAQAGLVKALLQGPLQLSFSGKGEDLTLTAQLPAPWQETRLEVGAIDFAFCKQLKLEECALDGSVLCMAGCARLAPGLDQGDLVMEAVVDSKPTSAPQQFISLSTEVAPAHSAQDCAPDCTLGRDLGFETSERRFSACLDLSPLLAQVGPQRGLSVRFRLVVAAVDLRINLLESCLDGPAQSFFKEQTNSELDGARLKTQITKKEFCRINLEATVATI